MARNNKKAKTGNTFYREAITGGMQKEPYTLQKFGKHTFKTAKYATYAFLAVTAIWGCVDGFLIKTDPVVSRGMEVYMTYDDVITSTYATAPETGFRIEGAEYNPFYYDEAGQVTSKVDTSQAMYISETSEITAAEIRYWHSNDKDFTATDAQQKHEDRGGEGSFATNDAAASQMGSRILPYTVVNPYANLAISKFNSIEEFGDDAGEWADFTNQADSDTLLDPVVYNEENEDEVRAHYEANDDEYNYDYNIVNSFALQTGETNSDVFVSLTELANPFNILHSGQQPSTRGYYGEEFGFTRQSFIEDGAIPSYLKQFTTSHAGLLNAITNIDYGDEVNPSMLAEGQLTGMTESLNPYGEYTEDNNNIGELAQTADKNNVGTTQGTDGTIGGEKEMLNTATWSETEVDRQVAANNGNAANITEDQYGTNIYREDAIYKAMNTASFVTGKEVIWTGTATEDQVAFTSLFENPAEAESTLIDWVDQGATFLTTNEGNDSDNLATYTVNIAGDMQTWFASVSDKDNDTETYEGSGMTYGEYYGTHNGTAGTTLVHGTSLFTTGHQPSEGFQITPSEATMAYGIAAREEDTAAHGGWENGDTSDVDYETRDAKMANGGFTMMDQNGNMVRTFKATDEATAEQNAQEYADEIAGLEGEELIEKQDELLYAEMQEGNYEAGLSATRIDDEYGDDQFNNMEAMMNAPPGSTYTVANYGEYNIKIAGDEELSFDMQTTTELTGMSALTETGFMQGYSALTPYDHGGTEDVNESIEAAGNTAYNASRIALVSWGQAWGLSPFYGAFVWPLSKVAIYVQSWFPAEMGIWGVILGIFLIVWLLRGFATLLNFKGQAKQAKMQEIQFQVQKINAKYARYADNKAMKQRKQMETMALYRKAGVNPMGSIGSVFATMPVFLAIWTIINSIFVYKTAVMGGVSLAVSPLTGIFSMLGASAGVYIPMAAAIIAIQIISAKLPNWLSQKRSGVKHLDEATQAAMKKSNRTSTIMTVVFVIMGLTVPALLGIYWMFSGLFTIMLNVAQHQYAMRKARIKHLTGEEHKLFNGFFGKVGDKTKAMFTRA